MPGSSNRHAGNVSAEGALLGFLVEGADHGYEIHRRFTAELGHVWHLSQSQAYAILKRLERRGEIAARVTKAPAGPRRQTLRVTAAGRRHFADWLEHRVARNARAIRLEFLSRLYFTRKNDPEKARRIYVAQAKAVDSTIRNLERRLTELPPTQVIGALSLDLRLRQMRLIKKWMYDGMSQLGGKV